MPQLPDANDLHRLHEVLPLIFQNTPLAELEVLTQAYPLLNILCDDRALILRLEAALEIAKPVLNKDIVKTLVLRFQLLDEQFNPENPFKYRLPQVLSEFPIHSRAINQSIQAFNEMIESLYYDTAYLSDHASLQASFQSILTLIQEHGSYCDADSLWQLLGMLGGWSRYSVGALLQIEIEPPIPIASTSNENTASSDPLPMTVQTIEEIEPSPNLRTEDDPFIPDYNYHINEAGRISRETCVLLLNAFGTKIGGHFDAQVKYAPRFIPLTLFQALIRRQLSHRLTLWPTTNFESWITVSLHQLGLSFIPKEHNDFSNELLINPFFSNPISFLSPEKILEVLTETLSEFINDAMNPTEAELKLLSSCFFELLHSFQFNPGQALGIGANWDGTINLSNESGAEAFRFNNRAWGHRFKHLSLHRQGPSEARMNAGIGIKVELKALLSDFNYMSQLQPSEYPAVIYNALIDNLVAELLPEPAYLENQRYTKQRKQHVIRRNTDGLAQIVSYWEPSQQGTYYSDRDGNIKQTPMYRRAGTLDNLPFPKNTAYSEQSRNCYEGNALGPMRVQYARALYQTVRGHIVYDPIAPDQFLDDPFFGQVLRSEQEDFSPFIGVIPTNYDRHLNQEPELCASFVIRMLQSSRIMEYCPTFQKTFERIKTRFLPKPSVTIPQLPAFCSAYIVLKREALITALGDEQRSFTSCHNAFRSLFKNLVYSLYGIGRNDPHFQQSYLEFVQSTRFSKIPSKAGYDKIIRELRVNRPVYLAQEGLNQYDEIIDYLTTISTCFYPLPDERLLHEIADYARLHVRPLLNSHAIQDYFKTQKENKLANLSRQHSPGMLHAALKYQSPSKAIAQDYGKMHKECLPSYYRDPDGTPNGEPQWIDKLLDGCAKTVGASLQLLHRYHLFGLIHAPISAPILHAREQAARHRYDRLKPLWAVGGALQGFFWHGIITGIWQTATTPFLMLADFCSWQFQWLYYQEPLLPDNPLSISAAPPNESSIRTLASAQTRDFLLFLLDKDEEPSAKKTLLLGYSLDKLRVLYSYLEEEDLGLCHELMDRSFSITDDEWTDLFTPLLSNSNDMALTALLQAYNSCINKELTQAVFRCITNPEFHTRKNAIIKETISFFTLNARQAEVLGKIMRLYQHADQTAKQRFFNYFRFNGLIHQTLKRRDRYLQRLQHHILRVFDEEWILENLLNDRLHHFIEILKPDNLDYVLKRLPDSIKGPLHHLLTSNNPGCLDHYVLDEKHLTLLFRIRSIIDPIDNSIEKNAIIKRFKPGRKTASFSLKEEAQNKLTRFSKQELRHKCLSMKEVNQLIRLLQTKAPEHSSAFNALLTLYQQLDILQNTTLDEFYEFAEILKLNVVSNEVKTILNDFIKITMNRVVNQRLSKVKLTMSTAPTNPLLGSIAIESWVNKIHQHHDLDSLFEQQLSQAPSLDHTLLRNQFLLQVLEQQSSFEKIPNTGMQMLLRFWIQHRPNVTSTGKIHVDPDSGETKKGSYSSLFQGSKTLQSSLNRVEEKLATESTIASIEQWRQH